MHSCMLRSIKPWRKGGVSQCLATLVRFLQNCLRYLYRPHLEAFSLAYYLCSVTRFHETTGWTKIIPIQRRTGATSDACTLGWWAVEGFGPWHRIEQPIEKGEQRPDQRQKEMCAPIYNWHLVAAVERSNFDCWGRVDHISKKKLAPSRSCYASFSIIVSGIGQPNRMGLTNSKEPKMLLYCSHTHTKVTVYDFISHLDFMNEFT
jgi:hypothetical protein